MIISWDSRRRLFVFPCLLAQSANNLSPNVSSTPPILVVCLWQGHHAIFASRLTHLALCVLLNLTERSMRRCNLHIIPILGERGLDAGVNKIDVYEVARICLSGCDVGCPQALRPGMRDYTARSECVFRSYSNWLYQAKRKQTKTSPRVKWISSASSLLG